MYPMTPKVAREVEQERLQVEQEMQLQVQQKVPLLIIPFFLTDRLSFVMRSLALRINRRVRLDDALKRTDIGVSSERYLIASLGNTFFFFLFFSFLFSLLFFLGRS